MLVNPDTELLHLLLSNAPVTALTGQRIYVSSEIPPELKTVQNPFVLIYSRGQGQLDEEGSVSSQLYTIESYGLRTSICGLVDSAIFSALDGRATHKLISIQRSTPRQYLQRPDLGWWFAFTTYQVMHVVNS